MNGSSQRVDPYRAFNFLITLVDSASVLSAVATIIQSVAQGGFSECSGLEMDMDIEEYKEGGNNGTVLRFPTRMKWTNIRLKRGMTMSNDLWLWHYGFAQGQVQRRDGIIVLQDEQQQPVQTWSFTRGLPVKWTGPSFNATQNAVAIEEIEIAHEGLTMV